MRSQVSGVVTSKSQVESLFSRAAAVSRETQCLLLLTWAAALSLASIWVCLLTPMKNEGLRSLAGTPAAVLGGSICMSAAIYFFAKFALNRKWSYAFTGSAFWVVACGTGLQTFADTRMDSAPGGILMHASWLAAGLLLAAAGPSNGTMRAMGKVGTAVRLSPFTLLCLGAPLLTAWCLYHSPTLSTLTPALAPIYPGTAIRMLVEVGAICALGMALVSQYRRYHDHADRISGVLCYFLVPCALSLIYRGIAEAGHVAALDASHLFALISWPVLTVGFVVDTALEQSEMAVRMRELETLHEVSWSVVGAQNLSELLYLLADSLRDKLSAKVVTIYLVGDCPGSLKVAAACGPDGPLDNVGKQYPVVSTDRWPGFHSGHTAKAFTTGVAQTARDVFVDVELVNWRVIGREEGCAVSLPMTDSDGTLGVLTLYFPDHKQLTRPRVKLLSTLAAAATSAIRNVEDRCIPHFAGSEDDNALDMAA